MNSYLWTERARVFVFGTKTTENIPFHPIHRLHMYTQKIICACYARVLYAYTHILWNAYKKKKKNTPNSSDSIHARYTKWPLNCGPGNVFFPSFFSLVYSESNSESNLWLCRHISHSYFHLLMKLHVFCCCCCSVIVCFGCFCYFWWWWLLFSGNIERALLFAWIILAGSPLHQSSFLMECFRPDVDICTFCCDDKKVRRKNVTRIVRIDFIYRPRYHQTTVRIIDNCLSRYVCMGRRHTDWCVHWNSCGSPCSTNITLNITSNQNHFCKQTILWQ